MTMEIALSYKPWSSLRRTISAAYSKSGSSPSEQTNVIFLNPLNLFIPHYSSSFIRLLSNWRLKDLQTSNGIQV